MLEQPSQPLRTTRSGSARGSPNSPNRGRIMRGAQRGNRIQPIIWNQNQEMQMMGGEFQFQSHLFKSNKFNFFVSFGLGMQGRPQQPFPSPQNRGQRARRGTRSRGATSSSNYGNMRY